MTQNRRSFLKTAVKLGALSISSEAFAAQGAAGDSQLGRVKNNADAVLNRAVGNGDVPGVAAGVTGRDETLYAGAHGVRALGKGAAMSTDTVMFLASMTKPITTAAAMQLAEQGKLNLDEPAAKALPEIGAIQVLEGYDGAGAPILRPPKSQITARQLLTHTSGFVYPFWNEDILRYYSSKRAPGLETATRASFKVPIVFDPGTRWQYGIGIDWAGLVVEAVSGMRLGEYFKRNITGPIGMESTTYDLNDDLKSRLAGVHARGDDGRLALIDFGPPPNPEVEAGGGALYSTADDYLKFIRMVLNKGVANGVRILKPETIAEMSVNNIGDLRVTKLHSYIPFLTRDAEFFPTIEKKWGLGFMLNVTEAPTGRSAGSLSWAGICNTFFWIDPIKNVGGVVMMQLLPFVDPQALDVFYDFETSAYAALA
jgi:methyl acetate hydrolase